MARFISYFFSIILFTSYIHTSVHSSEWDSSEYDLRNLSDDDSFEDYPSEDYELADFDKEKKNTKNKKHEEIDKHSAHISKSHPEKIHQDSDSNQALLTLESGPSAVVANCVNAISGDYFDSHLALTTPGPLPLVVQCSYCSSQKEWNFHHMPGLEVGKKSSTGKHLYAKYHDDNGSEIMYQTKVKDKNPAGIKGPLTVPKTLFEKGLTNCGSGEISGQTNWRNSNISYVYDKNKSLYKLQHGSGIQRFT